MSYSRTYRTLARLVLEAVTPIRVGSGEKDITTDARLALDINGLPYLPGSSIAGALRHSLPKDLAEKVFGSSSKGSEIIISDANLVIENGHVVDGIFTGVSSFLKVYSDLPIRQHVRIDDRGAAENHGKYDEAVVLAGSRFCFEMELLSDTDERAVMAQVISLLFEDYFRMGGGSRRGFGKFKVVRAETCSLDLSSEADLNLYLDKSTCLDDSWSGWKPFEAVQTQQNSNWVTRTATLEPLDFFLFASGHGNDDADITPVKEIKVVWEDNCPVLKEFFIIPGSSIKGSLAHRVAYHYNRIKGVFADKDDMSEAVGKNNEAVRTLFGDTKNRGRVIISDLFINVKTKILNHNSIDDFTGGAVDGHLFSEMVSFGEGVPLHFTISVDREALSSTAVCKALNCALKDLCEGHLSLGNGGNKGHGVFCGSIDKQF